MKWSTDKPTEPGYYWFCKHQTLGKHIYEVVLVQGLLSVLDGDFTCLLDAFQGEWAGPIPEPDVLLSLEAQVTIGISLDQWCPGNDANNSIPEYGHVELPDCCFTCKYSEFFQMNEYDPVCEHPSVRNVASGYRSQREIVENGWCPLFSRD